jgi:hypothetical protein
MVEGFTCGSVWQRGSVTLLNQNWRQNLKFRNYRIRGEGGDETMACGELSLVSGAPPPLFLGYRLREVHGQLTADDRPLIQVGQAGMDEGF